MTSIERARAPARTRARFNHCFVQTYDCRDTINVAPNTYMILTTLSYWSSQNYSLIINGAHADSAFINGGGINFYSVQS
ncbi:hypothetical protein K8T06_04015 [bacterium]|nr:hypothetical protein [bacterium]